jgi:hypothetical protein
MPGTGWALPGKVGGQGAGCVLAGPGPRSLRQGRAPSSPSCWLRAPSRAGITARVRALDAPRHQTDSHSGKVLPNASLRRVRDAAPCPIKASEGRTRWRPDKRTSASDTPSDQGRMRKAPALWGALILGRLDLGGPAPNRARPRFFHGKPVLPLASAPKLRVNRRQRTGGRVVEGARLESV